ncbi:MAG: hypothetical protein GXO66_04480 [Euryarchaeota archaeon]|nr:hypothetical protein [Euryarchaeota archaeon]
MRLVLLFILCLAPVQAAEIYGTLYSWETFEPLGGVVVEINTTPVQKLVSRDGSYSFSVPGGSYLLTAKYYEDNLLRLMAEEFIEVPGNGSYRIDLILFPSLEEELLFEEIDLEILEQEVEEREGTPTRLYAVAAAALLLSVAGYLLLRRRVSGEEPLPEDLAEVVEVLKEEGGRMKQSDLRKRLGCSEAKLSLMLTDLEHRGKIKKIKKGRGNIVILK